MAMAARDSLMAHFESVLTLDREQLAVERAIAEYRAGRPVVVDAEGGATFAIPAESLDVAGARALDAAAAGAARLALSGARLHRLGARRRESGALALPTVDYDRVARLAMGRGARLDAEPLRPTAAETAALALTHLAQLLPCVVAAPIDAAGDAFVRVGALSIAAYRGKEVAGLRLISRAPVPLEGAPQSEMVVFRGGEGLRDHAAVLIGPLNRAEPVAVRLHSACLTGDLFGSLKCDCGDQLRMTARHMAQNGGGVILYLDQEGRGNGLACKIRAYGLQADGVDTYDADEQLGFEHDQRGFDFAADMLRQLGVRRVRLFTNNPVKIDALAAAGVEIVSQQRVHGRATPQNVAYLEAKRDRAGHKFGADIGAEVGEN